ncbi:MAG: SH3 domain-containing protein [Alphaproteobacteria bacterium]|nr:SH3 domain-containing protein [Alphaproteobacteria bacterium]
MNPKRCANSALDIAVAVALIVLTATQSWGQDRMVPRFASVRSSEVNMRTGPGTRYPIDWVLVRRSQPVEIIDEHEAWRQIRDWQGDVGWVHRSMLRSLRTVIFTGAQSMRRRPEPQADPVAEIGAGVIAELLECAAAWCRVETRAQAGRFKGWVRIGALWGVSHTDNTSVSEEPGPPRFVR